VEQSGALDLDFETWESIMSGFQQQSNRNENAVPLVSPFLAKPGQACAVRIPVLLQQQHREC
jgi:hypothetical protein